jgi:hypothetical protein
VAGLSLLRQELCLRIKPAARRAFSAAWFAIRAKPILFSKVEEMMAITMDTQLGTLLDNPQAKQVIDKHLPGVTSNPMVNMVRGMSLNSILAMPQAAQLGLTRDKVEAILVEVNKVVK